MCGVFGTSPCGGEAAWKDIHTCTVERYTEATVRINKAKCFEPMPPSCDPVGVNPISGQLLVYRLWVWKGIGFLSGYCCLLLAAAAATLLNAPHRLVPTQHMVMGIQTCLYTNDCNSMDITHGHGYYTEVTITQ